MLIYIPPQVELRGLFSPPTPPGIRIAYQGGWADQADQLPGSLGITLLITASFFSGVYRMNFLLWFYNKTFQFM